MRLIFDLESDGFLDVMTRIHCLVIKDVDSGEVYRFADAPSPAPMLFDGRASILSGVNLLATADMICGHNVIKFDIPAIQKLYPDFKPKGLVLDTMVCSRLIWPETKLKDLALAKKGKFPAKLAGKHSLEAWGHRLGNYKGDFKGPWDTFTEEMLDYCVQDVEVTASLFRLIESKKYSQEAIELEHDVQRIIGLQEAHGFLFDTEKAGKLYASLVKKRLDLEANLKATFTPWFVNAGEFTPKRDNRKQGYTEGCTLTKVEQVEFNPASRDHIADRLTKLYGWKPMEFTDSGKVMVDEKTLSPLKYPPVPLILEYLLVEKRIGQLAEGRQAWLKSVGADGRIHGGVNPNGAVTGRMTHMFPNIAQVPSVKKDKNKKILLGLEGGYGAECRELFIVPRGKKLMGADASGLELRCLAHFMARYDDGAYAKELLEGDIHSLNQQAAGLPTRDNAKTFIYAFLYGAGDEKIGSIIGKGAGVGRALKKAFLAKTPALKKLKDAVAAASRRGYLVGLDGRHLHVRSEHAALNTLLQSAGALVMKKALVILYDSLSASGLVHGRDYSFVANVHDEFQIECNEEVAKYVGERAVAAIRAAGDHFKFRCPLDGESKVGNNWRDTH